MRGLSHDAAALWLVRVARNGGHAGSPWYLATFKDIPGGQVLGPTFDYTHRLLDTALAENTKLEAPAAAEASSESMPRVTDLLGVDHLIERSPVAAPDQPAEDLTREPLEFPASRECACKISLAVMKASCWRLAIRRSAVMAAPIPSLVKFVLARSRSSSSPEEVGFAVPLGRITVTECQMINQFKGSATEPPRFTRGYGLTFGHSERKAMSVALVDRALPRANSMRISRRRRRMRNSCAHSDNVQAEVLSSI